MNRRVLTVCAALGIATAVCFAGGFWTRKEPAQWSDKEVQKMLTDSPWAQKAQVLFDPSAMPGKRRGGGESEDSPGGMPPGGPGGGMPPGGPGGMPPGGPGGGGPGRGMGDLKLTVCWESALPVRQARQRLGGESVPAAELKAEEYYVISVAGFTPRGRQADPERMKEMLLNQTSLSPEGGYIMTPAKVDLEQREDGMTMKFYFYRTQSITPEHKAVEFRTAMGPLQFLATFNLAEMAPQGKLEL